MLKWRFAGGTDTGRVRQHNEDAYSVRHGVLGGFIVADGLGGHVGGEVASRIAVESLEQSLGGLLTASGSRGLDTAACEAALADAMRKANADIIAEVQRRPELLGMGCTLTAAVIGGHRAGDQLARRSVTISHVGDCRVYRWTSDEFSQLTQDHTVVSTMVAMGELTAEEAQYHPYRHVLDRAVGTDRDLQPDIHSLDVGPGDRLLLCSDGLWNMLDDEQLARILAETEDTAGCVHHLIQEANERGGKDNITSVIVDLFEEDEDGRRAAGVTR